LDTHQKFVVMQKAGGTGLFYWAAYDNGHAVRTPTLAADKDIERDMNRAEWTFITSDVPDASRFASYAAGLAPQETISPLYLRPPDAKPSVEAISKVRLATAQDIATLSSLHAQCFDVAWTEKNFATLLATPGAGALIVELAGTQYGFVQFQWVAGEAEINTICVSPNHRRQHFGDDLIQGLFTHLAAANTTRIFLEVAADNHAASALYEKYGFAKMGVRKNYYANGQDAITMSKGLAT
jgi:[ribosomal protein S18]-alanine N-acetyltransferase